MEMILDIKYLDIRFRSGWQNFVSIAIRWRYIQLKSYNNATGKCIFDRFICMSQYVLHIIEPSYGFTMQLDCRININIHIELF